MGSPYGSLERAIEEANGKIIIACGDTFPALEITNASSGTPLRIYGGFNCATQSGVWEPSDFPTVVSSTDGPALRLRESSQVLLDGFEFRGPSTSTASRNSIAAAIADSDDIVLRNVKLIADHGTRGADGAAPKAPLSIAPAGNDGVAGGPAPAQTQCTCSESVGGAGGNLNAAANGDGSAGLPEREGGGRGGAAGPPCQAGSRGGKGLAGATGTAAAVHGTIDELTWLPADGEPGGGGEVGQGGGGGGGGDTGGGGGGGCGGCGGEGGEPGQGGGSSIGLLMSNSTVILDSVSVVTGNGGAGGNGGSGQEGQAGGPGGLGEGGGCPGAYGANGTSGGKGGGGAGGLSVAVVYRGEAPVGIDGMHFEHLAGGSAGNGAVAGTAGQSLQIE